MDSIGITEKVDAWLHGFDPIAVEAGFRLAMGCWGLHHNSDSGRFTAGADPFRIFASKRQ